MLKTFLSIFALFISLALMAQQPVPEHLRDSLLNSNGNKNLCNNDMLLYNLRKNPSYKAKEEAMNKAILKAYGSLANDTLMLPVVVHIINQNPYSITDLQVINGIQDLNNAYSKSGNYSASLGADTKIRFCLAQQDPDGGNTTGVTRTKSFFSDHLNMDNENDRLKNLIQWDPSRYINIWLITNIDAESYANFSCGSWYRLGVAGYATMPPNGGSLDGIVVTSFGVLLAHEMGHYLGLYHTFQGGCNNNNCLTDGDMVCDTPPDNSVLPSPSCNNPQNSCNTDTLSNHSNGYFFTDVPDQIANFMDYGNPACSNEFTQGQADRMRAAIMTQRSGLLQNECTRPCAENIIAGFTRDVAYPVPGTLITFTNTSSPTTNYEWSVNGVVVATSVNFSYTFNETGKNKVTLKAFNTAGCFASSTDFVIVNCGVIARFYTNKKTIASMSNVYTDSIIFTNSSYNAQSYQWLIGNDQGMPEHLVSTSTNLTYTFPAAGNYTVRLIATNGACSDTTEIYTVPVSDPTADGAPFNVTLFCYQQTKVRISFCLADYGFAPLPQNTPVNFYDADPSLPTAHKLSPTFYLPYEVPGGNCYMCFSQVLDVPYHDLERIYLVFNDSGTAIPVVLPNTSLPEKNYSNNIQSSQPNRTTIFASICNGQNYFGHKVSGTYIDTLTSIINGCDSIRTLQLSVKPVFKSTVTTSICKGQNYAGHTSSGTYVDVFIAANGCDSTRTLNLTVKPTVSKTIVTSICQGQNYAGHTVSGTYVDIYTAANGCDSTRTLHLTVKPNIATSIAVSICMGENYAGHTAFGTYVDVYPAVNGCDSTRTLQLTVKPTVSTSIAVSICEGENYAGYKIAGTYVDVFKAVNGCDSTRTLALTVNPVKFTTVTAFICPGDNYAGHTASGTYKDIYSTSKGCDSTRTLILTVKPTVKTNITTTICEPANYAGHTSSGNYVDVYTGANGCDSTRTLHLTVNPRKFTTINAEICKGETYFAAGNFQTVTGVYRDTLRTYLGCDSIISTYLIVHPLPSPDLGVDRGVCIGNMLTLDPGNFTTYLWQDQSKNPTFVTNIIGTYSVMVTDSFGCKAADTMKLTTIYPLPVSFLPADSSLCKGNILQIKVPGYISYNWNTGSTSSFIDITESGRYRLKVTDRYGCIGSDSMNVFFYTNCIIIGIPNAFTPNKDGLNDEFKPLIPAPLKNYHMQIWNRWGLQVFETRNIGTGWDGKFKSEEQPIGVYVYFITYKDKDGKDVKQSGIVTLIR